MKKWQICKNCMYFTFDFIKQYQTNEEDKRFQCRRNAPQILCGSGTGWSGQLFPIVRENDWCGQYEVAEEKI